MKSLRIISNIVLLPIFVAGGIAIAFLLVNSSQPPQTSPPPRPVPIVEIDKAAPDELRPDIETFGTTRAYLKTDISSQVAGEVVDISAAFDVGLNVQKGELLATIDPTDYESLLAARKSDLAQAETALADEETRSKIAEEDWKTSGRQISRASDFTLRKPQLAAARAQVESARRAVEKATADLERTKLRAPYDAIVISRDTAPGNQANVGGVIGSLVSRERLEVELPLTPRQIRLLDIEALENGLIEVLLTSPNRPNTKWTGKVKRVNPEIDSANQTLRVIAEIENPFPADGPPIFVGSFLNARISGKPIHGIIDLKESQVVSDSFVWIVTPDLTLKKQSINIVHSADDKIYARITDPPIPFPLLVVSRPLPSFEEGMAVHLSDHVQSGPNGSNHHEPSLP